MAKDIITASKKVLSARELAYVFYVIFIESNEKVIVITPNTKKKRTIKKLFTSDSLMMPIAKLCTHPDFRIKIPLPREIIMKIQLPHMKKFQKKLIYTHILEILATDEFNNRWREFHNWRPAFVTEEQNLLCATIGLLEKIISTLLKDSRFNYPTKILCNIMILVLEKANDVLAKIEKGELKTKKELDKFLGETFLNLSIKELIKALLRNRGIEFLETKDQKLSNPMKKSERE